MPVVGTKAAASAQGFGEFAQASTAAIYIEDVFSTWLYEGNGGTQTITNGIDLSTKGGLVWTKARSAANNHGLVDTARGGGSSLQSNSTAAASTNTYLSFNTNGYLVNNSFANWNTNGTTYASWTFRKQPKFFDVVTYTGNGARSRDITHNLGSAPGFILVKNTSSASNWSCWHRSLGTNNYLLLNSTASNSAANINPSQGATYGGYVVTSNSTTFSLSIDDTNTGDPTTGQNVNQNGATYVAYLFAHNAGGFGLTGTDNVISCGSFAVSGGSATVNLGYEPQWILAKDTANATNWLLYDTMRGWNQSGYSTLSANTSNAESSAASADYRTVNSTGFKFSATPDSTWIYIAIRRGPMKTPTSGTSVFKVPYVRTGGGATQDITGASYPVNDLVITKSTSNTETWAWTDRLRGATKELTSASTAAEATYANDLTSFAFMTGFQVGSGAGGQMNTSGYTYIDYTFRRAPGFFDEVCYTGTGSDQTLNHNLGVAPELIIFKTRNATSNWNTFSSLIASDSRLLLNLTSASSSVGGLVWSVTSTTFLASSLLVSNSGQTYVAYLFASCPGVSKVGSYSGTGALQTINCGFTSGARFVLIKRTDSTGDWYVYNSVSGITSGNDPYVLMNSTAIEATATNYVDTDTTGFKVTAAAPAGLNASGGTYIFLAIA